MKYVAWGQNHEVQSHGLTLEGGGGFSLQPCQHAKVYKKNGSFPLWELNFGTQSNWSCVTFCPFPWEQSEDSTKQRVIPSLTAVHLQHCPVRHTLKGINTLGHTASTDCLCHTPAVAPGASDG